MKQPKAKPHLILSKEPLTEGVDRVALCEAPIAQAKLVFMWDEQEIGPTSIKFSGRVCKDCYQIIYPQEFEPYYVYGAIDGEQMKVEESDV